jgi:DNA gyrase subunit A
MKDKEKPMKKYEEKFIRKNIAELSRAYIMQFSVNVNGSRITPDNIDGLKKVGRRLLYAMYTKNQGKELRKVVAITGDVVQRFHPHGQAAVYACLVGLGQWWGNNIPLIFGKGNYGSISGDVPAADRYIYACLSDYAYDCFFSEWKDANVDMMLAFTEEEKEPLYLPAKYPNILVNGTLGIGIGLSSNIPPFNFKEAMEATIKLMKNPEEDIYLIPDSPTRCDICGGNFKKIFEEGRGVYSMRASYEIDPSRNLIRIITIPYQVTVKSILTRIAEIKENKGFPEVIDLEDMSRKENVDIAIYLRNDVNPYKFVKKLFESVGGLQNSYPVNITVTDDLRTYDRSVREVILDWIKYRREQRRAMINYKRTTLQAEQRTNDVKIFLMSKHNLNETIEIFRSSRNRSQIESRLIERFRDSEIRMDSLQAKTLSELRMYELSIENYEKCLARREELLKELEGINLIISSEDGIDQLIIAELKDGIKKFGTPRKSRLVPWNISDVPEVDDSCIIQLSSTGIIKRFISTDLTEEPVPLDTNGFALRVEKDSRFIIIDENGFYDMVKVNDIPLDSELPVNRYVKNNLKRIVALVPFKLESNKSVILISKDGVLKRFIISNMRASRKPCIALDEGDYIIRGILSGGESSDILIFTANGYGQRIASDDIRVTSPSAKGNVGVKLQDDDEVEGIYRINKLDDFLAYVTSKGKFRLNKSKFLPARNSKHDELIRLIKLNERDKLIAVVGVGLMDKIEVFFDDQSSEVVAVRDMPLLTMSGEPVKLTKKSAVSSSITKVKKV